MKNIKLILLISILTITFNAFAQSSLVSGEYTLQQVSTDRYLDADQKNGYAVMTRTLQKNNTQKWILVKKGDGTYNIWQKSSRRNLTTRVTSGVDSLVITQRPNLEDSQIWMLQEVAENIFTLQQKSTGRFLEASPNSSTDYQASTDFAKNNEAQQWKFNLVKAVVPPHVISKEDNISPGEYILRQKASYRLLDANQKSSKDYSAMTRPPQYDNSQIWILKEDGNGAYTLQQKSKGRYLEAYESSKDYKAVTRKAKNNDIQKWLIDFDGEGAYTIKQKSTNRFLEAYYNSGNKYTAVTRQASNNSRQKWEFINTQKIDEEVAEGNFEHVLEGHFPKSQFGDFSITGVDGDYTLEAFVFLTESDTMTITGNMAAGEDFTDVVFDISMDTISIGNTLLGLGVSQSIVDDFPSSFSGKIINALKGTLKPKTGLIQISTEIEGLGHFDLRNSEDGETTLGVQPASTNIGSLTGISGLGSLCNNCFAIVYSNQQEPFASSLPLLEDKEVEVAEGLTMIWRDTLPEALANLTTLTDKITLQAYLPKDGSGIELTTSLGSGLELLDGFAFRDPVLSLNTGAKTFGIIGQVHADLGKAISSKFNGIAIDFEVDLNIGYSSGDLMGTMTYFGDPFNIPGVNIESLGLGMEAGGKSGISGFMMSDASFGIHSAGDSRNLATSVKVGPGLFEGKINTLSITGFLKAFSDIKDSDLGILKEGLNFGLTNAEITVDKTEGLSFGGDMNIFGWGAHMDGSFKNDKVDFEGQMDPIYIGDFFELVSPDGEGGPEVGLSMAGGLPKLTLDGELNTLGISKTSTVTINKDSMYCTIGGSLFGGAFAAEVEVVATDFKSFSNPGDLAFTASMKNDIIQKLKDAVKSSVDTKSKNAQNKQIDLQSEVDKALDALGEGEDDVVTDAAREAVSLIVDATTYIPFLETSANEYKGIDEGLRVAGAYILKNLLEGLDQCFNVTSISFSGELQDFDEAAVNAQVKFTVFGSSHTASVTLNLHSSDVTGALEDLAAEIAELIIKEMPGQFETLLKELNDLIDQGLKLAGEAAEDFLAWSYLQGKEAINWTENAGMDMFDGLSYLGSKAYGASKKTWNSIFGGGGSSSDAIAPYNGTGDSDEVPDNIAVFRVYMKHIKVVSAGKDGGDDLEVYGSVMVKPSSMYVNEEANDWIFNKKRHQDEKINEGSFLYTWGKNYKTLYVEKVNLYNGEMEVVFNIDLREKDNSGSNDKLTGYFGLAVRNLANNTNNNIYGGIGLNYLHAFLPVPEAGDKNDFVVEIQGTKSNNNPQKLELTFGIHRVQ